MSYANLFIERAHESRDLREACYNQNMFFFLRYSVRHMCIVNDWDCPLAWIKVTRIANSRLVNCGWQIAMRSVP